MEDFQYESFDLDKPAFRLLRLLKGNELDIECELFQCYLDDESTIAYEALSYTWGGTDLSEIITINGKRLGATLNLYLALQKLRLQDEDRILWVDAICIHQRNKTEQGHQVRQMGKIYSQAHRVLIWLGSATDQTDVLMNSLIRLEQASIKHACGTWNLKDWRMLWLSVQPALEKQPYGMEIQQREGLDFLLAQPWFKRVWILQEVTNARLAIVCSGTKSVSTRFFALAPQLLNMNPEPHCQAVLDIMPGQLRKVSWWDYDRDLYSLLKKFCGSQATNPRDMLYALLDISSDAQNTDSLRADYTKDYKQVIDDAASFLFGLSAKNYQRRLREPCVVFIGPPDPESITIPVFVRSFAFLNIASLRNLAKFCDASRVAEFLKRRGDDTEVTEEVVKAAAGNRKSGKEVLELLIRKRGHEVKITKRIVKAAAGNTKSGKKILELLIRKRGHEVKITERIVKAAAGNTKSGKEILELLIGKREYKVKITERVFAAAAGNTKSGKEILELLIGEREHQVMITERIVKAAVGNTKSGKKILELLIEKRKHEVKITERIVEAAAGNTKSGKEILELLIGKREYKVKITERVVAAATGNSVSGKEILDLLYDQRGEEVVAAAAESESDAMELLLRGRKSSLEVTEKVLAGVAKNQGKGGEVLEFLLQQHGYKFKITEKITMAAVGHRKRGKELIQLLLKQFKSETQITEDVMSAAAGNEGCGDELMRLLLRQPEYKHQITEKVIAAAAGNDMRGIEVMRLLIDQLGHVPKLTEELVSAAAASKGGYKMVKFVVEQQGSKVDVAWELGDTTHIPDGVYGSGGTINDLLERHRLFFNLGGKGFHSSS